MDTITERNHGILFMKLSEQLPMLFGYQHCGVLFVDNKDGMLYSMSVETTFDNSPYVASVVKYPSNLGLTGIAHSKGPGTVVRSDLGGKDYRFLNDIDNLAGVPQVRNLLVGVIGSKDGEVTGVIHLLNKEDKNGISPRDEVASRVEAGVRPTGRAFVRCVGVPVVSAACFRDGG